MLRLLELFCGIGGCAEAMRGRAEVTTAVDIHQGALFVYRRNFPSHPICTTTIESLTDDWFRQQRADLWWMSPPCQPYTVRGKQRDLDDPRAASLVSVMKRVEAVRPGHIALENVPPFQQSRAAELVRETLNRAGYETRETVLCPSELGVPNWRRRFYLVASREKLLPWPERIARPRTLAEVLCDDTIQAAPVESLYADEFAAKYARAIHVLDRDDLHAVTHCFTSAYGRTRVHAGSLLREANGRVRRFSPAEILRLLGFSHEFALPKDISPKQAWPLVGNSLSVDAVRWVLSAIG